MGKRITSALIVLLIVGGMTALLYPTVSDWWNSSRQSRAFSAYDESVSELSTADYGQLWEDAHAYNEELAGRGDGRFVMTSAEQQEYEELLNVDGSGMIGTLVIPSIGVKLPIYHGTSGSVLQTSVGHLEGSSLPVGGEGTHAVLSGHRGLPSARLLTDIDKLEIGDTFIVQVLDEDLVYEVDQILVVEPTDVSALAIEEGQDLCTLMTCTPYGINTHRLLVRGHRVSTDGETGQAALAEAAQVAAVSATVVAAGALVGALLVVMLAVFAVRLATTRARRRLDARD